MRSGLTQSMLPAQKLIMTPKLQQAIQILMMDRMELRQYLQQALEQNPLLEEEQEMEEEMEVEMDQELGSEDLEVKICPICGAEAPLEARRCPSCGSPLRSAEEEAEDMPDIDLDAVFDDTMSITERMVWEEEDEEDGV